MSAPIIAHTLGADGRGVLAGAFVVLQVVGWVAFLGLPGGLALQREKRNEVSVAGVWVVGGIGLVAAVVTFLVAPDLANGDSRIELGIRIGAGLLVFWGLGNVGDQLAWVSGKIITYNVIRSATLVFPSFAIIVLFFVGHLTLPAAYISMFAGQVLSIVLGVIVAVRGLRAPGRAAIPWRFSLRSWFAIVFDSVGGRGDQLALTALSSSSVVGVYAIAVTCANAASGIAQGVAQASLTHFVKLTKQGVRVSLARLTLISLLCTLSAGVAIFWVVSAFGQVIFGPDFGSLAPIVAVLVVASALQDVWKLRVARDSARETAGMLAIASAIGLAVMAAVIVILTLNNALTGLSMAGAFLAMGVSRLLAHIVLSRLGARRSRDT
ncbi:hypothetical protein [Microbacterium sp. Clip185]|uniref:hypothetical protein n=1 Tax=Microbacterium sp. Clip185 TaxID=3025663 RepID=UPI0023663AA0|nr:hypothetical protein [Microbacterium sp. Clip185]WDG18740.1 hypothetical protein PQV94_03105 [Microbacterium sp. Clip185]